MIRRIRNDQRGATAILVAASLLLLVGMAALTIDWGLGTNQRRQNQSGADFAALAGAQFATVDTACGGYSTPEDIAACNATNEIIDVVNGNLGIAPGTLDWAGCVDTTVAATYPEFTSSGPNNGFASPITDCVRFTENLQQVRVVIPTVDVDTTFGKVLGRDIIATSAFAHSQADFKEGSKVIPFALPSNIAGNSHGCLKTQGSLLQWDVCTGPVNGNFGSLDIQVYGNVTANTVTQCGGNKNNRLVTNIARGVDHRLETQPNPAGSQKNDETLCPVFNAGPNSSPTVTGVGSALEPGLIEGSNVLSLDGSSYPGRLYDAGGYLVRNGGGSTPPAYLDNTPLWNFLSGGTSPAFCAGTYDFDGINTPNEMRDCLDAWVSADGIIFSSTIKAEQRYAFIPEFHIPFGGPPTIYRFKSFRPVYLNTTYWGCNSNSCQIVHVPGVADTGACGVGPTLTCGTPGSKSRSLNGVTAFILQDGMLPADALDPFPGANDEYAYALTR